VIVVVDYGTGNPGAIVNMLEFLGFEAEVSAQPDTIVAAKKLILPGVGAFDRAMRSLRTLDLIAPLELAVLHRHVPVLGVCLGMQLLGRGSEEGDGEPGLGWIAADTVRFRLAPELDLKVPHVGWSPVRPVQDNPLFALSEDVPRFYFVHSYHMRCDEPQDVAATCEYGERFCCAISKGHIHGVQFHPEKSHRHGMALLKSFAGGI
jgi:glutamine amidotransferase